MEMSSVMLQRCGNISTAMNVLCFASFCALQLDGELFTLSYNAEGGMLCYMRPLLHVCEKSVFSDMYTLSCPGILASLTLC